MARTGTGRLLLGIGTGVLFAALCVALAPDAAWAHGGGGGRGGGGHGGGGGWGHDDDSDDDSDRRGKRHRSELADAERLADAVVLTDDNPRGEPPADIVAMILAGMARPERVRIEHDRLAAIQAACTGAAAGDVVLVAGKGHEDYQLTAAGRRDFSDRAVLAGLTGGAA